MKTKKEKLSQVTALSRGRVQGSLLGSCLLFFFFIAQAVKQV